MAPCKHSSCFQSRTIRTIYVVASNREEILTSKLTALSLEGDFPSDQAQVLFQTKVVVLVLRIYSSLFKKESPLFSHIAVGWLLTRVTVAAALLGTLDTTLSFWSLFIPTQYSGDLSSDNQIAVSKHPDSRERELYCSLCPHGCYSQRINDFGD